MIFFVFHLKMLIRIPVVVTAMTVAVDTVAATVAVDMVAAETVAADTVATVAVDTVDAGLSLKTKSHHDLTNLAIVASTVAVADTRLFPPVF